MRAILPGNMIRYIHTGRVPNALKIQYTADYRYREKYVPTSVESQFSAIFRDLHYTTD